MSARRSRVVVADSLAAGARCRRTRRCRIRRTRRRWSTRAMRSSPTRRSCSTASRQNLAVDWPGPVDDPANVAAIDEIIAVGRACRARDVVQQRHGDGADGNARRHRGLRYQDRPLHFARLFARRRHRCATCSPPSWASTKHAARRHRGCRRRLRAEERRLSGISGSACGRQETRPKGALDGEPVGGLQQRQPGARQCHGRRTRARQERKVPRAARASGAKSRRLCCVCRHPARDQQFRALLSGDVRHSQARYRRAMRLHQYACRPARIAAPAVPKRIT